MKERIDILLVERGHFKSRERAKTALMEGIVFVDGQRVDKAGTKVDVEAEIKVKGDDCPYVSRGGYKLAKAIKSFDIDLKDKVCADLGASTGGFTDVMLQSGARKVFSVDVGYGQLDWKLRNDPRVVNIEKCNVRYMDPGMLGEKVDFVSIDVSFISLGLIFPVAKEIMKDDAELVALIKPQFEAGREEVSRTNGIIKDPAIHEDVIMKVVDMAKDSGLFMRGLDYSPVKGAKGNIEFLINLAKVENIGYNRSCVLKKIHDTIIDSQSGLEQKGQV